MKFSWFKQHSNEASKWEEERTEKEYVRKHERQVRKSRLEDMKRFNIERKQK